MTKEVIIMNRKSLGKYSRDKGKRFEREIAHKLNEYGIIASRSAQHCGKTGQAPDLIGVPHLHIECKAQEKMRLYDWMAQATTDSTGTNNIPAVVHKANGKPILVSLRFDDFLCLYLNAFPISKKS